MQPMIRFLISSLAIAALLASAAHGQGAGPQETPNRLAKEASPYLRQHALNPVDWYPWGKEAFEKARRENKPILLSVGYFTCHWCHVMERESYSDQDIAKILNNGFVAIKVDRERRPDVDETYMLATQLITQGGGGWPNNVFLTPDLKPFLAGTYFPPDAFQDLLRQVALRWLVDSEALQTEADRLALIINRIMSHRTASKQITPAALKQAVETVAKNYDFEYGGQGTAPKFPRENLILFLLDQAEKHNNAQALKVATATLDGMIHGGIHDHVGGGFHRYSVDRKWLVPHFEKMLYNQANIGRALLQAYRITGARRYARAARGLFDFVLRDMAAPGGGFYAAFDADSPDGKGETEEGIFYIWSDDEFAAVLGKDDAAFASSLYGTSFEGNFEGRNILHLPRPILAFAAAQKMSIDEVLRRQKSVRAQLLAWRGKRPAPPRDDKILTAWNGAMILALGEAAVILGDQRYRDAALLAAGFFWQQMGASAGDLKRYHYDGAAALGATQLDYAFLALGFISVFDATNDALWLQRAKRLGTQMNARFLDEKAGDYFMTAADSGFYRPKISSDGDLASGNAAALDLFSKLAKRDLDPAHRAQAEAVLAAISGTALDEPEGHAYALRAADQLLRGETGAVRHIAKGRVRALAHAEAAAGTSAGASESTITVRLDIAPGWHVNAHKPLDDFFVPTVLKVAGSDAQTAATISYPKPIHRKLGFHDKPLALYEGRVEITAELGRGAKLPRSAELTVQACSDKICLEPETVTLSVLQRK